MRLCKKITLISVGSICTLIWLVLAVFCLVFFDGVVMSLARQNAVMSPETQNLWGEVPGETGTQVVRNFTFYNFTNPMQFLFQNKNPIFTQFGGYIIQEQSSFLNYQYSEDQSIISYDYWTYFGNYSTSRNLSQFVYIMNPAPLGFWSQLNNVNQSVFMIQGLGQLFVELNSTFKLQIIGQGIASTFLPSFIQMVNLCEKVGLDIDDCSFLWQDPVNGLSDSSNYQVWVKGGYLKDTDSINYLFNYYRLQKHVLMNLLNYIQQWSITVSAISDNWYSEGKEASNFDLVVKQMSHSGVTNDPPLGVEPSDTFCSANITCDGFPQISAFVKNILGQKYINVTFSEETFKYLLTRKGMLHIGHLNLLFQWGKKYDNQQNNQIQQSYYLHKIMELFRLESQVHAEVFWKWAKYFTNQFVLKASHKGDGKTAGLAGIFAVALYQSFVAFNDWIIPQLIGLIAADQIGNCHSTLTKWYSDLNQDLIANICHNVTIQQPISYNKLFQPCQSLQTHISFTPLELETYCEVKKSPNSVMSLMKIIDHTISEHYGCEESSKCSAYELSMKQFVNSSISLNPLNIDERKPSLTANEWDQSLQKFEYQYFIQVIKNTTDIVQLKDYQLRDLLSFDKLWSAPMLQTMLLSSDEYFQQNFYWKSRQLFNQYIRYVVLQIGFGGFTQKRTIYELLYGYQDPFLKTLQQTDPILGGDPSIPYVIAFNGPNSTREDPISQPMQMNTGIVDPYQVRQFLSIYNKEYIVYNSSWFNGDEIGWSLLNPYTEQVKIKGGDGFQEKPSFDKSEQCSVYLPDLTRYGTLQYKGQKDFLDFTVFEMRLKSDLFASSEQNPSNAKYHQLYNGFINLSFQGFPLYLSRNHYYGAPTNWSKLVDIYDQKGNKMQANIWDDTVIYLQPYTGISFSACIYLQSNYYYSPDILFTQDRRMLPIFSLYRSGNVSQGFVDDYLSDLKFIIQAKRKLFVASCVFILMIILIVAGCILNDAKENNLKQPPINNAIQHRQQPNPQIKESLMESLVD